MYTKLTFDIPGNVIMHHELWICTTIPRQPEVTLNLEKARYYESDVCVVICVLLNENHHLYLEIKL